MFKFFAIMTFSSLVHAAGPAPTLPNFNSETALIMVDVQHDFMPGGALAVTKGDEVIPVLKNYASEIREKGGLVVATQDWHPQGHCSFSSSGKSCKGQGKGIWPDHCVQGTHGAEIAPEILAEVSKTDGHSWVIRKGNKKNKDAYSGFDGTDLAKKLKKKGVKTLLIGGLATDYCVRATALDGIKAGFKVYLLVDGSRGVEVHSGDIKKALLDVQNSGGTLIGEQSPQVSNVSNQNSAKSNR